MTEIDTMGLVAFLREECDRAIDDVLNEERATALDFYNGRPFGDEEDGRSQVVTRDVAEVIDYMTVSLLRTFISGDKVVEFECADKNLADQITMAVTQEFFQGQNGVMFLQDWIKAGLLEKNSVAKVCVEYGRSKRETVEVDSFGLAELADSGAQIIGAEQISDDAWQVEVRRKPPVKFRDYVVPNEEVRFSFDARDLDDDCVYIGFAVQRSLSQLAEMGFETDGLSDDFNIENTLSYARDATRGEGWREGRSRVGANRKVWVHEEYCLYDIDGDGIAERLQVYRVGNQILTRTDTGESAIEIVDDQPGVSWCPFPMPHRIVGQSLADKVMDIQRVRSVLLRQGLDNIYQSNAPRTLVHENSVSVSTYDDLMTVRPGGVVRWQGNIAPTPFQVPFVAQSAFDVMEVMAGEKESRTGITRLNQGLDADALNKTATGTALMQAQGQQIEEYLARMFGEAFAKLMLKKYRLMRKFGSPMELKIDGEVVTTDPSQWPEDMLVNVRVGLGTGRREQRIEYRLTMLQIMERVMQGGSRIVSEENLYKTMQGLVADMSLGSVVDYLTDPSTLGEAEEKPDPAMAKAQADAMINAEKLNLEKVKAESETMMRAQQMEIDAMMRREEHDANLQAKREDAALQAELARDKAMFEANLARQQADREFELALMRLQHERELAAMKADQMEDEAEGELPNNRPGGSLAE